MSIETKLLDKKKRKKGQVLIVGEKKKDIYYTDGVVVYDSYSICSSIPQILQSGGRLTDEVIYITGHGNKKKQTISGLTMAEIAKMLKDNYKYDGKQEIVILSCYGLYEKNGLNMANCLKKELENILSTEENNDVSNVSKDNDATAKGRDDAESTTQETNSTQTQKVDTNRLIGKISAIAEHTTVIFEADKDNAYVYDLEVNSKGFGEFQHRQLKRMSCKSFNLDNMEYYYNKYGEEIDLYNRWLVIGKRVDKVMERELLGHDIKNICVFIISLIIGCVVTDSICMKLRLFEGMDAIVIAGMTVESMLILIAGIVAGLLIWLGIWFIFMKDE